VIRGRSRAGRVAALCALAPLCAAAAPRADQNFAARDGARIGEVPAQTPAQKSAQTPAQTPAQSPAQDEGAPLPLDAAKAQAHAGLERGLTWLAAQQLAQKDGSFPRAGGTNHVPVALAALGALAFMSDGSAPQRGEHGEQVALAIDYLLAHADMNVASPARGYISSEGDQLARMHGHGYATIALAQAFTLSPKTVRGQRIAEVLKAATHLIESSQGLEGGWFYLPGDRIDHENSVTVVLLQALRAARNVGVDVDSNCIARAVAYVGRCQSENGSFRYTLEATSESSLALTAAGIATLNSAGRYTGPEIERAMTSLWQQIAQREVQLAERAAHPGARSNAGINFPHYEQLYVALALWTQPDRRMFERWYAPTVERVLEEQQPDGAWRDEGFGACYATAMNCILLALPQQLLPLFER
jgi:hypothetical protein